MEGRISPLTAMEWKKLYLQMEGKLKQFRIQATNIKLKLSQKMEELTIKCEQAEAKAEDAEYQLNLLRESLAGIPGAADQEERFCREKMTEMERTCLELQERNAVLEKQLENERYLRKLDKETLHEKAVRIKDWVSRALGTAEKEKQELQESNQRLTAAVQAMQQRLTELLESSASPATKRRSNPPITEQYAVPTIRSYAGDRVTPPPVPDDPWNSPGNKSWHTNPLFGDSASEDLREDSQLSSPPCSPSPLSMELDHCDTTRPTNSPHSSIAPGNVVLETKPRAVSVKIAGAKDIFPGERVGDQHEESRKKSSTLPMAKAHVTSSPASSPATSRSTPSSGHNIMGTFGSIRRRFKGLTDHHQRHRSHEETPLSSRGGREKREKQRSKSKSPASRSNHSSRLHSSPMSTTGAASNSGGNTPTLPAILQEEEDMSIDPPASAGSASLFSSSLPANSSTWKGFHSNNRPPTPPLHHRLPSWESKIYDMTKTGFRIQTNVFGKSSSHKHSPNLNYKCESGEFVHVVYKAQPLTVPVYTKIKGRATQIRPHPFTDASDSSDDDRTTHPIPRHLSPRHHHQRPSRSLTTSGEIVLSPTSVAMQQRKNGSPGLTRAFKRANSQQSMASSEGDYAIPPDAMFPCAASLAGSDSSEPGHKLLKTSKDDSTSSISRPSSTSPKQPVFEPEIPAADASTGPRCGYLTKLGGRVRTWKKRWFVMKNGTLFYYKSLNDLNRKPQGQIPLTGSSDVTVKQDDNDCTFQVTCGKKTYYLNADSSKCARDWVKALHEALAAGRTSSSDSGNVTCSVSGWLTRTTGGSSCHVYAVMRERTLEFFENENSDEMPVARLSLNGCTVEATRLNIQVTPTGGHARPHSPPPAPKHVIVVRPINDREGNDVFLSFETESEKANWLRALTPASRTSSSGTSRKAGTFDPTFSSDFERLLVKLVQANSKSRKGGSADAVWRHPVVSYSKQGIARPLTSLSSDALRTEAMKISKSIQLFSNVSLDAASADYHVTLAQVVAQSCLSHVELRDELFAQLVKLTNRRESDESGDLSLLQSWKLMSLFMPLFLPRDKLLLVLRSHLVRHSNPKTEVGQYVVYCQRAMERTSLLGERSAVPSRTESLPILLQNPYQHSRPFSVPVHFADGSYQVVSFDGSSTVSDFSRRVTALGDLRHHTTSGFALYVDDPESVVAEHYIEPQAKICDVISTWESQARRGSVTTKTQPHDGAGEQVRVTARFSFRRRLTFKAYRRTETEKEKLLLVSQIGEDISCDRFPLSRDLAIEMASLASQVQFGDVSRAPSGDNLSQAMKRFMPARYRENASKHQIKQLRERISERWMALEGTSKSDAARIFLNTARKWPLCGAVLFLAKIETSGKHKGDTVWLAVTEDCLSILNQKTMEVTDKCEYADLVTFGGCKDFFMVVAEMAGVARKLFFSLSKVQMLEIVRLMADYMNASPSFGAKLRPRKTSS